MKNYTYVKDESGKITDILVDGKPVKRGSMRGFRKAQAKSYFVLYDDGKHFAENPISGVTMWLNGLEATIYAFCMRWYQGFEKGTEDNRQLFDDMKYFLLELNSNAYYDLID